MTLVIDFLQFCATNPFHLPRPIFGHDQFFCLNFGRDQKLGEENEKGLGLQFLLKVYYSDCQKWFDSTISSVHTTTRIDKRLFRKYAASGNVEYDYRVTKRASLELSSPLEQGTNYQTT